MKGTTWINIGETLLIGTLVLAFAGLSTEAVIAGTTGVTAILFGMGKAGTGR